MTDFANASAVSGRRRRAQMSWLVVVAVLALLVSACAHRAPAGSLPVSASASVRPSPMVSPSVRTAVPYIVLPSSTALAWAEHWLQHRGGVVALAVVDTQGRLHGYHLNLPFGAASVVKAMLLVECLRGQVTLSPALKAELMRMIVYSDNLATDRIFARIGTNGLAHLARVTGMRDFKPETPWALTRITAADQARFFAAMDSFIPSSRRALARRLLSSFGPYRGWGIPGVAVRLGWRPFFKDGWMPTARGQSVLQVVRLERRDVHITVAVFTDGQPTPGYAVTTIHDVGWLLLDRSRKGGIG